MSTSSEVVNSVFEGLALTIDQGQGLRNLAIEGFRDLNTLQEWPLKQLALKCHSLQSLKIYFLESTEHNGNLLMEFASLAVTTTSNLHTLHIESSRTRADAGEKFLQVLADHRIHWLQELTLALEPAWFEDRDTCMQSLIVLLARQANLKLLNLSHGFYDNYLTEEQKQ